MTNPRIPTPAQVRAMPVGSVRALRGALENAGLYVKPGGAHLRVTTESGVFVATMPMAPSDPHSLKNCRTFIARRIGEIRS